MSPTGLLPDKLTFRLSAAALRGSQPKCLNRNRDDNECAGEVAPSGGDAVAHPARQEEPLCYQGDQGHAAQTEPEQLVLDGAGDEDADGDGEGGDTEDADSMADWISEGSEGSSLQGSDLESMSVGEMLHLALLHQRAGETEVAKGDNIDDSDNAEGDDDVDADLRSMTLWEQDLQNEERLTDHVRERALPTFISATAHVRKAWLHSQGLHSLRAFAALLGVHGGGSAVAHTRAPVIMQHARILSSWVNHVATAYGKVVDRVQPGGDAPNWEGLMAEYVYRCAAPRGNLHSGGERGCTAQRVGWSLISNQLASAYMRWRCRVAGCPSLSARDRRPVCELTRCTMCAAGTRRLLPLTLSPSR